MTATVLKCVAYKSKANVTADYENIKYYFQAPHEWHDQDPTGSSHWDRIDPPRHVQMLVDMHHGDRRGARTGGMVRIRQARVPHSAG